MPTSRKRDPFEVIPGVGPRTAADLRLLGFRSLRDIAKADPEAMYRSLCRKTGIQQDRCVLYVFRCAVYFASRKRHDPRLLSWWNWKDRTLHR